MTRLILTTCMLSLWLCDFAQAAPPEARLPEKHRAFFKAHCFDCHDSETQEGKVDLEKLPLSITTLEQAELWQKVLNALNAGEMPPEDSEQPGNTEKADFLDDLARTMVTAHRAMSDSGGRITMRRLNRREYQNTIEHLLGIKVDVSSLPADGGSGTFDTVGASQFISSDQIEQYLKLGRSAIDELFEREAALAQETKVFRVEPEDTVNVKNRETVQKMEETWERFSRWKAAVDKAVTAPENQEVMARLREEFPDLNTHRYRIYSNANRLPVTPDPKEYGFGDAQSAKNFYHLSYDLQYEYEKHYSKLPHNDQGAYLKVVWGIQRFDITPPKRDLPPGTYKLRVRAGVVEGSPSERHFIEIGHPQRVNQVPAGFAAPPISSHQVTGTIKNPEIIETTVEIGASTPREFSIQEKQPADKKELRNTFNRFRRENGYGTPPAVWVDWIELEGPIKDVVLTESGILRVEPEKTINPDNEKEIAEIEERQKRFARWKKGVDEAAKTPENQAIITEIRKTNRLIDHPNRFYTFADRLKGTPNPSDFGFVDSGKAAAADPSRSRSLALHKHYASLPHRDRGTYLKLAHGTGRIIVPPQKKDLPPGSYVMRVRVGAVEGTPASRRFIQVGHPQRLIESRNWGLEGPAISTHQVTGTIENPETIEIPLEVTSNTIREFAVQEKQPNNGNLKALWDAHNKLKAENGYGHPPAIWIDWVELEGPHNPSSPRSWKQRREVEEHANAKVGGTYNGYFKGGHANAKAFLETGKPQKGIVDEQEAKFRIRAFEEQGPSFRRYLDDPLTKTGSFLTIANVNKEEFIALPPEHPSGWRETKHVVETLPPGDYKLRFRIGAVEGTPSERHFVDLGAIPEKDQFKHLATFQITGSTDKPQTIEVPVQLTNDGPRKFALREKRDLKTDDARYKVARKETGVGPDPALWIDWVEWEGPLNASGGDSSRNEWWITDANEPDESSRARKVLEQFAYQAFRGVEAEEEFIDRLANLFATRRKAGDSFDTAIRLPLSIILASPGFLYLNEPNDADERRQLTDRELAVRMAYFLWSAPPDQELLDLAKQQKLSQGEILRQQVDRLITDARSDEFVSGFVHQWLDMERLDFFQFDTTLHREFDESTRSAARQEVYHSFAHLLRQGIAEGNPKRERGKGLTQVPRSRVGLPSQPTSGVGHLGKLLKSDHVFVNGLLANYYGIDGVTGDQFQRVSLSEDSPRGGLLGMAAIHAMGSDGIESSPVERGAWVLRYVLNDPPPPAPPNVPQISRLKDQVLTTRERLLAHQEEAQCASCHRKIDPIGFGLENFNAAGKWRTEDSDGSGKRKKTWKIDASGAFHKGPAFSDYRELRDLIAEREEDFARGFTEHLIEYALGRPFGFNDEELANDVVSSAKTKQFAVSEFIHTLVQSKAFRTK